MWQPLASPLVRNLSGGEMPPLALPARPPLAELPSIFDAADLELSVIQLSELRLEGRGLGSSGLDEATAWVESRFAEIGIQPAGDDGFRQSWSWTGGEPGGRDPAIWWGGCPGATLRWPTSRWSFAHLDHPGRGWPDVRSGNAARSTPAPTTTRRWRCCSSWPEPWRWSRRSGAVLFGGHRRGRRDGSVRGGCSSRRRVGRMASPRHRWAAGGRQIRP
jgi:hypothetical protein